MAKENKPEEWQENKIMEHDYDGIHELDNPPPRWIMAIFYITIGFAILYGAYYFWLDVGDHQDAEYAKKSARHDELYKTTSFSSDEMVRLTDPADIEQGKQIFNEMNCFACHGMNGEGNAVGPNLTDDYWIHGCSFQNVFNMIRNGSPAKGMTAFKTQISDDKIQKVASYVFTLRGTNPPNAKAPQGEECKQE